MKCSDESGYCNMRVKPDPLKTGEASFYPNEHLPINNNCYNFAPICRTALENKTGFVTASDKICHLAGSYSD